MGMGQPTDEELLQRIALKDKEAFAMLYDRYGRPAYSLACRIVGDGHDAEDVVQEVFLNVWRLARSFDERRGVARSWLLSSVHHRAVDVCRRRRGQPSLDFPGVDSNHYQSGVGDVWQGVSSNLDRQMVEKALAQLPVEQKQAIELSYFGGYTHREIAEKLNIPLGTVKSRIRMGVERLRDFLKDQETGAWSVESR